MPRLFDGKVAPAAREDIPEVVDDVWDFLGITPSGVIELVDLDGETDPFCLEEFKSPSPTTERDVVAEVTARLGRRFGRAALVLLQRDFEMCVRHAREHHRPERGSYGVYLRSILGAHVVGFVERKHRRNLWRERADEMRRDAAREGGRDGVAAYLDYAAWLIRKHQRAFPKFLRVPGTHPDDFREDACVELAAAIAEDGLASCEVAGMEATIVFCERLARRRARARRWYVVTGPWDESEFDIAADTPGPLEIAMQDEVLERLPFQLARLRRELSRTQLGWLEDFLEDVREHGRLKLARVAARRGRNRATAVRAMAQIRATAENLGMDQL